MLRVVAVQRDIDPSREFILLQNQSALRVPLRDHVLLCSGLHQSQIIHVFTEDENILGSTYVQLRFGSGPSGWARTRDGSAVFVVFAGDTRLLSSSPDEEIRLLRPCHSFRESIPHVMA